MLELCFASAKIHFQNMFVPLLFQYSSSTTDRPRTFHGCQPLCGASAEPIGPEAHGLEELGGLGGSTTSFPADGDDALLLVEPV
jgi:hypothetical protein